MLIDKVFLLNGLKLLQEFLKIYLLYIFAARKITSTSPVTGKKK